MISIITGTLNRSQLLTGLIKNTVQADDRIELILADGGSRDNTVSYIKKLNHPRIKLIEIRRRSPYPHYMNKCIKEASYDWICQWNDDVLLINSWNDVFNKLDDNHDMYLFSWKMSFDYKKDIQNKKWMVEDWNYRNDKPNGQVTNRYGFPLREIVMNYGIYHRKVFQKAGMYNNDYRYYCADGDMSARAYMCGFKSKDCKDIKVACLATKKRAQKWEHDKSTYIKFLKMYDKNIMPANLEYLK